MLELWTEKYFPETLDDFLGNKEIVHAACSWAEDWNSGKRRKPLLFWGKTGSGKTCLAYLLAKIYGWQVFELNASDLRSKENIEKYAGAAAFNQTFGGEKRLVLLDEVDGLQRQDRGGSAAIAAILKETMNPVILTANEIYGDKKILPITAQSEVHEFRKINYLSIAARLKDLLKKEGIEFEGEAIQALAKNSDGDMRSALLDCQALTQFGSIALPDLDSLGYRERSEKIFSVMEKIFKGRDFKEIRMARIRSEVETDLLKRWVEENIPRIYVDGDDTALAFDVFSRADVFDGRIYRRQHYGFLRYSSELATTGMALARENDYHGWLRFQFPGLLKKLSRSSAERAMRKEIGQKIGKKTHSSSREVMSHDLPYIQMLLADKRRAIEMSAQFRFTDKELAFLLRTKPDTKKVKSILEEAELLRAKHITQKTFYERPPEELGDDAQPETPKPAEDPGQTKLF